MGESNGERRDIPAADVRRVRRDGAAFLALALVTELLERIAVGPERLLRWGVGGGFGGGRHGAGVVG